MIDYINPYALRVVKVNRGNEWFNIKFEELVADDQFMMFEDQEEKIPVKDFNNNVIFRAVSNPYLQKNEFGYNVLTVDMNS